MAKICNRTQGLRLHDIKQHAVVLSHPTFPGSNQDTTKRKARSRFVGGWLSSKLPATYILKSIGVTFVRFFEKKQTL